MVGWLGWGLARWLVGCGGDRPDGWLAGVWISQLVGCLWWGLVSRLQWGYIGNLVGIGKKRLVLVGNGLKFCWNWFAKREGHRLDGIHYPVGIALMVV